MLRVKNLKVLYNNENKSTLEGVSFEINSNGLYFIVGEAGSGKTTLCNALCGITELTDGDVCINDDSRSSYTRAENEKMLRDTVSYIYVGDTLISNFTVSENVALGIAIENKEEKQKAIISALEIVEMRCYDKQKATYLSTAQKKRIAIATAIMKGAKIIILDEPDKDMNEEDTRELYAILTKLSQKATIIVTTESNNNAVMYADKIATLQCGNMTAMVDNDKSEKAPPEIINADNAMEFLVTVTKKFRKAPSVKENLKLSVAHMLSAKKSLITTLITFVFALTTVGLAFGSLFFAFSDSAQVKLYKKDGQELALSKQDTKNPLTQMFYTEGEQKEIKEKFAGANITPIYFAGTSVSVISGHNIGKNGYYINPQGMTTVGENNIGEGKFDVLLGRLPTARNEVALTLYTAEGILQDKSYCSRKNIEALENIIGNQIKITGQDEIALTVTGIVDTGTKSYYDAIVKQVKKTSGDDSAETVDKVWKSALEVSVHRAIIASESYINEVYSFVPQDNMQYSSKADGGYTRPTRLFAYGYYEAVGINSMFLTGERKTVADGEIVLNINSLKSFLQHGHNWRKEDTENLDKIKEVLSSGLYVYNIKRGDKSLDDKVRVVGYLEENTIYGSAVLSNNDYRKLAIGNRGIVAYSSPMTGSGEVNAMRYIMKMSNVEAMSFIREDVQVAINSAKIIAIVCGALSFLLVLASVMLLLNYAKQTIKMGAKHINLFSCRGMGSGAVKGVFSTSFALFVLWALVLSVILLLPIAALLSLVGTASSMLVSPIAINFFTIAIMIAIAGLCMLFAGGIHICKIGKKRS